LLVWFGKLGIFSDLVPDGDWVCRLFLILKLNFKVMKNTVRVIIPRNAFELIEWAKDALSKHEADGVDSRVKVIDTEDLVAKVLIGEQAHLLAEDLGRLKENETEQRNVALGLKNGQNSDTENTVRYLVLCVRDFLLGSFRGEEQRLGDWGFEVNTNSKGGKRVVIPHRKVDELILLGKGIVAKHNADGAQSLLGAFNMTAFAALVAKAELHHEKSKQMDRDKQKAYEQRNNALGTGKNHKRTTPGTVIYYMICMRDVLFGQFKGQEMALGAWGFKVLHGRPRRKPKMTVVSGAVRNKVSNERLPGAKVSMIADDELLETVSDSIGNYEFELMLKQPLEVEMTVDLPGYVPLREFHELLPRSKHGFDLLVVRDG
jgi:hypothetical protein